MARWRTLLTILERRGLSLAVRLPHKDGRLPSSACCSAIGSSGLHAGKVDVPRRKQPRGPRAGGRRRDAARPTANGRRELLSVQELHEVREVNRGLEELRRFGLTPRT